MFGKTNKPTTRLRELKGSDFQIAKGQPDIHGWDVRNSDGRKLGVVSDLIFDIRGKKVRYIVLNIHDVKELELEKRTVLVPIGMAELDTSDDDVILTGVTPFQLRALPAYRSENLGAKVERDISTVFGRSFTPAADDEDVNETFYEHEQFNESNMLRRRKHDDVSHNALDPDEKRLLKREAELGTPVSNLEEPGHARSAQGNDESDEAYFQRTGKRRGH